MSGFRIGGGIPLSGEVQIQGSKNAALPIMAAAILQEGISVLQRCPKIADVFLMQQLLIQMGCRIRWEKDSLWIDSRNMHLSDFVRGREHKEGEPSMRSTITLLGAMLGRFGFCAMDYPGGCVIGERPIDMHLEALRLMGAEFIEKEQGFTAKAERLVGAGIRLRFPSVGATENILLAAVRAEGETRIYGAASEPEIEALCGYLKAMGCRIYWEMQGMDTVLVIRGTKNAVPEIVFPIPTDRIVAGTYLFACAGTGGEAYLRGADAEKLTEPLRVLERMGASVESSGRGIYIKAPREIAPQQITTGVYPAFPTDLQSPAVAVLCGAQGESTVRETVFENRFRIVEELRRMGAKIEVEGSVAKIHGRVRLHGETVQAKELRGGAALVLAGLMARGVTRVENHHFIERGYENISRDLKELGARISFE